jgi:GT2 family glycosyltransferase
VTLSIVVVSWNVHDYLRGCLRSLEETGAAAWTEVIVVDNDSADGSAAMVRAAFPWVTLIESGSNLGFSRGNNLGLQRATGEFALLLNPDTVVRDGALRALVDYARANPATGAVGPRQIDGNGETCFEAAVNLPSVWNVFCDYFRLAALFPRSRLFNRRLMGYWDHESDRDVEGLQGSALLLRRAALDQVGLLDESMHYAEDMDLCLRLQRAGWRIRYLAAPSIVHYGGRSSDRAGNEPLRYQIAFQSFWYFLYKHHGRFAAFRLSGVMAAWSVGALLAAAAARLAGALGLPAAHRASSLGAVGRAMLRWSVCDKGSFRHHLARPLALDATRSRR